MHSSTLLRPSNQNSSTGNPPNHPAISIKMDDDPPPYSSVVPLDHVGWSYDFPCRYPPSSQDSVTVPLRSSLTNDGPSMPYRLFVCGSGRGVLGFDEDDDVPGKDGGGRTSTRKYGAILVGGAVIIFLMVLSLLVRFVMDKNLWRG